MKLKFVTPILMSGATAIAMAQNIDESRIGHVDAGVQAVSQQLVAWRRDIHSHPELSGQEVRTAKLVADHLKKLGLQVTTNVGGTGVVAVLQGTRPGKVIALRADMDALPVKEMSGLPFSSQIKGINMGQETDVAHACGHDGHTAILMGVAAVLASMKDQIPGTVKFIFQPSEEGYSKMPAPNETWGARAMVEQGALENPKVDAIFGLHLMTNLPVGIVGYRSGPLLASADTLQIKVSGKQTHGAMPWSGVDPIVASSQIVLGLQTIVSRQLNITNEPAVITVGSIHGGNRENIIPDTVQMLGTVRTFDEPMRADAKKRITQTAESIANASGAQAEVKFGPNTYSVTNNNPDLTQKMLPALTKLANSNVMIVPKVSASEDFSEFQKVVPGFFFLLGGKNLTKFPNGAPPNHSPYFEFDEAALPQGVRILSGLALDYLMQ